MFKQLTSRARPLLKTLEYKKARKMHSAKELYFFFYIMFHLLTRCHRFALILNITPSRSKCLASTINAVVFVFRRLSHYHSSHSTTHLPRWHFQNRGSTFQYVHNPLSEFLSSLRCASEYALGNRRLAATDPCRASVTLNKSHCVYGEQKDLSC